MPTLTELQTERQRLKALEAGREFDEALAATRPSSALLTAGKKAHKLIADELAALSGRLLQAIAGEHDETRVHYLMSDAVHTILDGLGKRIGMASHALPEFGARFRRGARPRDLLTVSQHADKHRWIGSGTNAPGQWRTSLTPYLRSIQDDLSEHSPARTVVFCKSAGVGGTEAMFNWINYVMTHLGNRDMMVVVPSLELRDRSFNPRLNKMITENARLKELISMASRNATNRTDILEYGANVRLIKAGANSPDSLRSDHLPYVICDEVDAYKWDLGGEGDPMTLIENRQRTFSRAKTFLISTPASPGVKEGDAGLSDADESRIFQAYERSDRRRYHVPCPHCGTMQHLMWGNLKYKTAIGDAPTTAGKEQKIVVEAWYVCQECGAEITEGHKPTMLAAGRWIAERPHVKLTHGYHINALYAPIGLGLTWRQVAQKWVDVQNDTAGMKAFVNTYLGEIYREKGDGADAMSILARVENYTLKTLISAGKVLRITAGVDVQKDRLEASIAAWGAGEESWLLDHIILPGDTTQKDVWDDLDIVLTENKVQVACVDAGYNTSSVLEFCASRRWCFPTKGISGTGRALIEDARRRAARLRARKKKGQPVEPLGVDQGKALIYARLRLPEPGPGYVHFPADPAFDDEYFAQLAAEELHKRVRSGRVIAEWRQIRPRNEALDCVILNLAACRLAGPLPTSPIAKPEEKAAPARRQAPQTVSKERSEWAARL